MPGNLYLHEVVDVVGQGAVPYMEHTAGFHAETATDRGLVLLGTWQVVGATGRWPQVVNVWEMVDGWAGWRRLLRTTNVAREQNRELARWWEEAYRWRTGGVDRLLAGTAGCPSLSELTAAGISGELFVHETAEVQPGRAADYLDAVIERRAPVLAGYGHHLVGAYEVLLRDHEVVTIWATDVDGHARLMEAQQEGTDGRLAVWRTSARQWLVRWGEELMVPHRGTPLAPRDA